jgi:hypothetical protein
MVVGDHLHLDVPWILHELLEKDRPSAERRLRLPPGPPNGLDEVFRLVHGPHPASATAGARLDEYWVPNLLGLSLEALLALVFPARISWNGRHLGLACNLLRPHLVPNLLHRLRRWADPDDPRLLDRPRELRVLREEAVPRMHRSGAAFLGDPDDVLDVQVALGGFGWSDEVRLVGETDVHRTLVRLRVDGDGGYAELAAGPDHAHRNLPAVGDEQLLERRLA